MLTHLRAIIWFSTLDKGGSGLLICQDRWLAYSWQALKVLRLLYIVRMERFCWYGLASL